MTSIRGDGSVEFRFYRPQATKVCIAGDFNEWAGDAMAMQPAGDGWWTAVAKLSNGEYRFRYLADGDWFTDFAAYGIEFTNDGTRSMLLVPGSGEEIGKGGRQQRRPAQNIAKPAA